MPSISLLKLLSPNLKFIDYCGRFKRMWALCWYAQR